MSQSLGYLLSQSGKLLFGGSVELAGFPESHQAGSWSPRLCVTHEMKGAFFLLTVTLTVQQWWRLANILSWESWLKIAVFLLIPAALWASTMDTNVLWTITLFFFFWFSKHFFRLCCFSHCFTKQPHKHLHKHDGGAETDTVFKSSAVWER